MPHSETDMEKTLNIVTDSEYLTRICRALFKATNWVLRVQDRNGSWGRTGSDHDDVFGTYLSIWALCELGLSDSEWVDRGIYWFKKHRNADGGWGYRLSRQSSPDQTARGLITLARVEKLGSTFVEAAKAFVVKTQNPDGSWSREIGGEFEPEVLLPGGVGDVGSTLPMVTALTVLRQINNQLFQESLENAKEWILNMINDDGGLAFQGKGPSDPLATAWAIRALRDTNVSAKHPIINKTTEYLRMKQLDDGSWGREEKGNIIYTYNGLHSLILCGSNIHSKEIRKAITWLLTRQGKDGSWGEKNVGTVRYTASLIMILARVLKTTEATLPYCSIVGSSMEIGTLEPMVTLSRRFSMKASKNILVLLVIIVLVAYFLGFFSPELIGLWKTTSATTRNFIIIGVLLVIVLNLASAFLYKGLQKLWDVLRKWLHRNQIQ